MLKLRPFKVWAAFHKGTVIIDQNIGISFYQWLLSVCLSWNFACLFFLIAMNGPDCYYWRQREEAKVRCPTSCTFNGRATHNKMRAAAVIVGRREHWKLGEFDEKGNSILRKSPKDDEFWLPQLGLCSFVWGEEHRWKNARQCVIESWKWTLTFRCTPSNPNFAMCSLLRVKYRNLI